MTRTTRPRKLARNRPRFETLESRALLSLAGAVIPFTGSGTGSVPLIPGSSSAEFGSPSRPLSAVGPDGTVVLATAVSDDDGFGPGYFSIAELNADGTLNTSFGQDGRVTVQVSMEPATTTALVVRPDGTIDVGGLLGGQTTTYGNGQTSFANATYGVLQITPQGTVDTSFGSQGIATLPDLEPVHVPLTAILAGVEAMTLTPSGQLIVAGEGADPSSDSSVAFYVARLNTNGTLDTTFGTNGSTMVPVTLNGLTIDQATAVAIAPDGEIVVAGNATKAVVPDGVFTRDLDDAVVIGLTSSGQSSASGEVILPFDPTNPNAQDNLQVVGMAIQSGGQIVLAETGASANAVANSLQPVGQLSELNADGTIATSFGNAGTETFTNGLTPLGISLQPDGKILVPGFDDGGVLGRFDADGSPDITFGTTATPGLIVYKADTYNSGETISTATINAAGQIILGGISSYSAGDLTSIRSFQVLQVTSTSTPALDLPPADYDGSGQSNLAVYLTASGEFAYRPSNGGPDVVVPFGIPGPGQTIPAPGDYDGAGQTEIAAYLPSQGVYAYKPATGGPDVLQAIGIPGPGQSIPAPGDYFGSGVDDIAVYMPSIGAFGIRPSTGGPDQIIPFGTPGMGQSIPAPADYFNTGQTDIAVYLTSIGAFAIRNPTTGADSIIPFGIAGAGNSIPIPGDYDGSGKTELAVYLPKLGEFAYRPANGGPDVIEAFGAANDGTVPVPGDYTGVGHDEIAVYDPTFASFAYRPANGAADVITAFGTPGLGASLPTSAPISLNTTPPPSTVSAMSVSVGSTAVPAGPKGLASTSLLRIASTLPAQADPSKPKA